MPNKSPTTMLSEEHKNILKVIDSLISEVNNLESSNKINKEFFEKAIGFIRGYADKFHHAKEEDLLFVELCKDTVQMHCNPTHQMRHEHHIGRGFVKAMESGLKENNKQKLIENARSYAELLREHIFKEDNILYPMADEALSKAAKELMLKKFNDINKKISKNKTSYLSFVKKLQK